MIEIMGYEYSATGIYGYEFYENETKICTISSLVIPSLPVTMQGMHCQWESIFPMEQAIVSGTTRPIVDTKTQTEVGKIIYKTKERFEICLKEMNISVYIQNDAYLFSIDGKEIASIEKSVETCKRIPEGLRFYDIQSHCYVRFLQELSVEGMMAVLAFPMLIFSN